MQGPVFESMRLWLRLWLRKCRRRWRWRHDNRLRKCRRRWRWMWPPFYIEAVVGIDSIVSRTSLTRRRRSFAAEGIVHRRRRSFAASSRLRRWRLRCYTIARRLGLRRCLRRWLLRRSLRRRCLNRHTIWTEPEWRVLLWLCRHKNLGGSGVDLACTAAAGWSTAAGCTTAATIAGVP